MKHRDLNAPPAQTMAEIVRGLRDQSASSKTGAHGVKHMGDNGDSVWTRPDGTDHSVREIDADLDAAQGRIDDAEADLADSLQRLGVAEQEVSDARADLTELETVTLPGAVADLEAADAAAQQAVVDAEQRATDAREGLATQIDQDIADARTNLEADIDTVRTSVDGKSTITQSVDSPPTQYDGAVGDRWERMSSMGSGGSLISNWRWNGDVWVSTVISDAVLGNVDAAKIGTGYLDAARLEAGSIQASSIAVGDFTNLATIDPVRGINVPGETVTVGDYTRSDPASGDTLMFKARTDSLPFQAGDSLRISFIAKADDYVRAQFRIWAYIDATGGGFSQRQITGSWIEFPQTDEARVEAVIDIPDDFGEDAVYRSWRIGLAPHGTSTPMANLGVRAVSAYRMTGATLIQDGAVTTDKVAANAIEAGKIAAGAVRAEEIDAGVIDADHIVSGGIQADSILVSGSVGSTLIEDGAVTTEKLTVTEEMSANIVDAMSVTAKELIVTEQAILKHATLIGDTVVDDINVTGKLIGEDGVFHGTVDFANINVTGDLLAESISGEHLYGNVVEGGRITGGSISTGSSAPYSTMTRFVYAGTDSTYAHGLRVDGENGARASLVSGPGTNGAPRLDMSDSEGDRSIWITGSSNEEGSNFGFNLFHKNGTPAIRLYKGGEDNDKAGIFVKRWDGVNSLEFWGADGTDHAELVVKDGAGNYAHAFHGNSPMYLAGNHLKFYGTDQDGTYRDTLQLGHNGDSRIEVHNNNSTRQGQIRAFGEFSVEGSARLNGDVRVANVGTTGADANALIDANGWIYKSTSSRRYKRDIVDWEPTAEQVLALRPREWTHDDPNNPPDVADDTRYVGFIAEEVHDLGLDRLVRYVDDEDGNSRPDALHYGRFAAAHQVVLKDHEARIAALESENADLRATVDALTARLDAAGI